MASVLVELPKLDGADALRQDIARLLAKILGAEGTAEGDRLRFGSAVLLIGPLCARDGKTTILVSWPDGLYQRLGYELRAFAASQKIEVTCF